MQNIEQTKKEYGFDYGDDECMMYLYPRGIMKALRMVTSDPDAHVDAEAYEMLQKWLGTMRKTKTRELETKTPEMKKIVDTTVKAAKDLPVVINIIYSDSSMVSRS